MKNKHRTLHPLRSVLLAGLLGLAVTRAGAHAFLQRAEPAVGSTVKAPPTEIRACFTEGLDAKASSLQVFDATGKEVDKQNVHPDPREPRWLLVSLPPALGPGTYRVVWHVVALDTHATQGEFTFRVEP